MNVVLTKVTTPIIGWIGSVLGWIINAIYSLLELIGIPNIGLSIILFTLVIYLFMTPLQIKQQKFSKMNAIMQPEIQRIQKKYKGKKDQDSVMKQILLFIRNTEFPQPEAVYSFLFRCRFCWHCIR